MLMRIAAERALLFDPLVPNEETVQAMKVARQDDLVQVGTVETLLAEPRADN